jgi:hypothetical protein
MRQGVQGGRWPETDTSPLALTLAPAALCTQQPFGVMTDTSLPGQTGARQQHARCSNACKGQLTCMTTGRIIQVPTVLVD